MATKGAQPSLLKAGNDFRSLEPPDLQLCATVPRVRRMQRHHQKLEPPALDLRNAAPAVSEEHLAGVPRNRAHRARR
eukprot:7585399-Alexandrium_andersonii.AAC.1